MTDTNVFQLSQPGTFTDLLTEVLRNGARALLVQAVEAEVATLLSSHADKLTDDGHQRLVRHGHLPEREIMTGIGPVAVRCPRVRDRGGEGSERIRFSSAILPPYARRSKSLEVLIPILYLKGVSTGDFEEALLALLGKDAGGLSASTIGRLKDAWSDEHVRWSKRDLSAKRYVYFWVDGIHVQARLHGRPRWHTCNVQEHIDLIAALEVGDKSRTDRLLTAHLESVLTRALDGVTIEGEPKLGEVLSRYSSQSGSTKVEATKRKRRGTIHGTASAGRPRMQREAS